jgi:flagellar hook-associated protein 2
MGTSASSIASPTFNGSSTYSSSFQQVLTRAVQIASLPMQQLQNHVNDLTNQQSALSQLESTFVSLDANIQSIAIASTGSTSASVSDPSVVSAASTSSALPGAYSIQVDGLGGYTTTLSQAGSPPVTDATAQSISSASSFTLTVNGKDTTITPADGSIEGLATAINSSASGVQATIVNLGSNTSPDYRLVVTSGSLSPDTIHLSDGSSDLLGQPPISTGSPATYRVSGSNTELQSDSRQVTLAPGLTVTLLNTSSQADTITVSTDYSALQNALSSFATAYNSAVNAVAQQTGQAGGALAGQSVVYTLTNILRSFSQYSSGSGSVASMNDLGLSVDQNGQMSFDASIFDGQNAAAITQFLGGASTGGFLKAATDAMTSVDDTSSGVIETQYTALQGEIATQNQLIQADQSRIADMQASLQAELTQADAAIATLEEQKSYYTQLFQAEYPSSGSSGG